MSLTASAVAPTPAAQLEARSAPESLAIDARDLRMRYGSHDVLTGLDLSVAPGEVLALLGPNGAGKTTTIEILEGFRRRSGGTARVLGIDPDDADDAWQARIGIVLQSWRDHRRWQVRQLLDHMGAHYRPYSTPERPKPFDTDTLLAQVGLTAQAQQRVGHLSGGQRRRLDVAMGLVGDPELLFLDEPTVGFDPEARQDFHHLIRSISERGQTAIVLTTHDLVEAETLADSLAILVDGRIVAAGDMRTITAAHTHSTRISYRLAGREVTEHVTDVNEFLRGLLALEEEVTDVEVRPMRLEDAYLAMIREHEGAAGQLESGPLSVEAGAHAD